MMTSARKGLIVLGLLALAHGLGACERPPPDLAATPADEQVDEVGSLLAVRGIARTGPETVQLAKPCASAFGAAVERLFLEDRIVPAAEGGAQFGVRFIVAENGLLSEVGIRRNDVIKQINDVRLTPVSSLTEIAGLISADEIVFGVERGGVPMKVRVHMVSVGSGCKAFPPRRL